MKRDPDSVVRAALDSHPLLVGCPDGTIARMIELGRVQAFEPKEFLSREGEVADYWLLCSGSVRVLYRSEEGVEVTVKLFAAPAAWAEMEVLTHQPHMEDCAAVDPSVALRLKASAFMELLDEVPRFTRNVLQDTAARFYIAAQGEKRFAFAPVPERVAHLLLAYVRMYGVQAEGGVLIRVKLSQSDIANGIGAAQKSVARTLSDWIQAGWLTKQGRSFLLRDIPAIEAVIQTEASGIDFVAGEGVRAGGSASPQRD